MTEMKIRGTTLLLITVFFKNLNSNIYIQSNFDLPQGGQNTKTSFCLLLFGYWQGHVIVKPNLLILKPIVGYGYLFFGLCPT